MSLPEDAWRVLQETSRTFVLPIRQLPAGLQEAIASAYLCMRAIDELEDHPSLECVEKIHLLRQISQHLQTYPLEKNFPQDVFLSCFAPYEAHLPEVTRRLGDWVSLAAQEIAPRIWEAIATMAERMASWVEVGWCIQSEDDLDRYTYSVAGATGILLCDLWAWSGGEQLPRTAAIQFGRGLQAVNILRNREEDLARGVDFFPTGWTTQQMYQYTSRQLVQAEISALALPSAPFEALIHIPLALAKATLDALMRGESKLSRCEVLSILEHIQTQAQERVPGKEPTSVPLMSQAGAGSSRSQMGEI